MTRTRLEVKASGLFYGARDDLNYYALDELTFYFKAAVRVYSLMIALAVLQLHSLTHTITA
jgi:hypothetical protein